MDGRQMGREGRRGRKPAEVVHRCERCGDRYVSLDDAGCPRCVERRYDAVDRGGDRRWRRELRQVMRRAA